MSFKGIGNPFDSAIYLTKLVRIFSTSSPFLELTSMKFILYFSASCIDSCIVQKWILQGRPVFQDQLCCRSEVLLLPWGFRLWLGRSSIFIFLRRRSVDSHRRRALTLGNLFGILILRIWIFMSQQCPRFVRLCKASYIFLCFFRGENYWAWVLSD